MAYMRHYAEVCDWATRTALGQYGPTMYRGGSDGGGYRSNVGEWWNGCWHWDCLGFVHTMVNGFRNDRSLLGGGAVMDDFVNSSSESTTLYKYCSRRGAFYPGLWLRQGSLLEMHAAAGHVGLYVGGESKEVNTAECTGGGARLSWTDLATGNYYDYAGGPWRGRWENWGEFDRVDYGTPGPPPAPKKDVEAVYRACTTDEWLGEISSRNYDIDNEKTGYAGFMEKGFQALGIRCDKAEIFYRVKTHQDGWLEEVSSRNYDLDDPENGYAGWAGRTISALAIRSSDTRVAYRVRTRECGWLGEVSSENYNLNDHVNGYAGWNDQMVTGIAIRIKE